MSFTEVAVNLGDIYYMSDFGLAVPKFEVQFAKTHGIKGADGIKINLRPDDEDTVTLNAFVTKLIQKAQN